MQWLRKINAIDMHFLPGEEIMAEKKNHMAKVTEDTVLWTEKTFGFSESEIGGIIGVEGSTVHRWKKGRTVPRSENYDEMEDLRELKYMIEKVFGEDTDRIREWLHTQVDYLNGRTPVSYLRKGDLEPLIKMLSTIASGAHR